MSMLDAIGRFLLHLCQYIAYYLWILFWLIASNYGDKGQLRPRECMVQVVFQEVVFWEIRYVAGLYAWEKMDVRGIG